MSVSRAEFIRDKLANFNKFLAEMFAEYPQAAGVRDNYAQLAAASPETFSAAVTKYLLPYDGRVDAFVDNLLIQNSLDSTRFKPEHIDKFKRYIALFIDVVK